MNRTNFLGLLNRANDGKTAATGVNQHARTTRSNGESHSGSREDKEFHCTERAPYDSLCKGLAEIPCHVANEAMNRCLGDAIADERVHGLSHNAQWWFVKT